MGANELATIRSQIEEEAEVPQASPRGFVFWSLAPLLLVFVVLMPLLTQRRDPAAIIVLVALELLAGLTFLGLFNSERFWWAWRGVGAIIFFGYAAYVVAMLVENGGRIAITPRKSEASAFNAVCGLVVFGLPGLWFALFGRLTFRKEDECDREYASMDSDS